MLPSFNRLLYLGGLSLASMAASADSAQVETCYQNRDTGCLEASFQDIVNNPSQYQRDAMHYLALIYLERQQPAKAKRQLTMAVMFGDQQRSQPLLDKLLRSGQLTLEAADCLKIQDRQCFLTAAQAYPEEADVAYYLLAKFLSDSDPQSSVSYLQHAASLGHKTASCILASAYAGEPAAGYTALAGFSASLALDYTKARHWSLKCGKPFPGFSPKHYKRYLAIEQHKAYVRKGPNYYSYSQGAATAEIAQSLAGELCRRDAKLNNVKTAVPCLIASVDDVWVDYFEPPSLPTPTGSEQDLLKASARSYYQSHYQQAPAPKVFLQGPLGNWSAQFGKPGQSLDQLTEQAMSSCHKDWQFTQFGSRCKAININGQWLN